MSTLARAQETIEWADGNNPSGEMWFIAKAQAYAAIAQAEAMQHIAMHLGNIHQTLITPNAKGEPITAADTLERIAKVLESFELNGLVVEKKEY